MSGILAAMRLVVLFVAACAAAALAGSAASAPAGAPALSLLDTSPPKVHGRGFHAHERVRVTLRGSARVTRTTYASAVGTFTVVFRGTSLDRCNGFGVTAAGNDGSRASLLHKPLPECAPLAAP